ncbi:MAG: General secretion pathway protein M [Syntrophorhabdus sp. PtaU1.Bin058]|nr:MAG: General secretion pathway protein M [Syntrophorhabdus sp. PtaU1.Bin058]
MKRKNRLFTIAIPVIAVLTALVAYQYGYLFIKHEMASLKEAQSARTKALEKSMKLIMERPELEKRLNRLKEQRKADASKIIEAQTISLAAATLQDTVKGIITGRGGSITSERVERPDNLGKFQVINVSIDAVLPNTQALSDVLFGMETRTPYLVVREMDARIKNIRDPGELMVKIRVSALTGGK